MYISLNNMAVTLSWAGLELTTDALASSVRNVVTTLFVTLNILIAFAGEHLMMLHGQRQLLRGKPLPITNMIPFFTLTSTLKYIWILCRLPGGGWGLLMIVSGSFGLLSHYLVNSYVDSELVPVNCMFESGVVVTQRTNETPFSPSSAWPASALVVRAQQAAITNNESVHVCQRGVYSKINYNATSFCPTVDDVIGKWICMSEPSSAITPADRWLNSSTVETFVDQSSFLYKDSYGWQGKLADDGGWSDLMVWSANSEGGSLKELNIRALFALDLTEGNPVNTSNFQCTLNVTKQTWSPPWIKSIRTLTEFGGTMLGSVLNVSPNMYGDKLELVLNEITMVSGTSNSLWNATTAISTGAGQTYGCKEYLTVAHPPVFIIFLVLLSILLLIFVICLWNLIRNANENKAVVKSLPVDYFDWQLAMAKALVSNKELKMTGLPHCEYSLEGDKIKVREHNTSSMNGRQCTWNPAKRTIDVNC